jgi:hypothetical protein
MDKKLIIFSNEDRLKEVLGDDKDLDIGDKKLLDGVQIELFSDSLDEAKLVQKPVEPQTTNENLYFILHTNAQENYESIFRKEYPGAKIEVQSHIEGQFYYTYLPRIENGAFSQKDLEDFFQTKLDKALNDLCDTWATIDFTDKEAMQTLATDRINKLNSIV